jgi:hypothetical protein
MEPGHGRSSGDPLNERELEAFWGAIPLPKTRVRPPMPVQRPDQSYSSWSKRPKPARNFVAQKVKPERWQRHAQVQEPEVARAWVYRTVDKERLFVVFAQPLPCGFPMQVPEGLVEVDQEGRWEMVNPKTLCFRPVETVLRFQQLLVNGKPHSVEGRNP